MSGIWLNVLHISAHLKLLSTLFIKIRYLHVRNEELEAKRVK